jgi:threonine synthase
MVGFQAAGAAPIVLGRIVENPQTVASAIRIGNPASWEAALIAVKESMGAIDSVTDEEILQAYRAVAATEGVFCEPASAASVAGVMKLSKQGGLREGETVVCTLTGHGLKDADTAINVSVQPKTVRATREDVARLLKV